MFADLSYLSDSIHLVKYKVPIKIHSFAMINISLTSTLNDKKACWEARNHNVGAIVETKQCFVSRHSKIN